MAIPLYIPAPPPIEPKTPFKVEWNINNPKPDTSTVLTWKMNRVN